MRRDKPSESVAFGCAEASSPTAMPVRPARMRRLYVAQAGFETRSKGTGFAHKPRLGGKGEDSNRRKRQRQRQRLVPHSAYSNDPLPT